MSNGHAMCTKFRQALISNTYLKNCRLISTCTLAYMQKFLFKEARSIVTKEPMGFVMVLSNLFCPVLPWHSVT
ncbi:hypothetical protein LguiA_007556 [Lonicera macranthoides]